MLSSLRLIFRTVSRFPVLLSDPWFLRQYPCFILQNTVLPCFLHAVLCTVRELVGSHRWIGGVPSIIHVFNQEGVLTCHPDLWFQTPVRLPFPQGTGELSSVNNSWVGPRKSDCDLTVYPPPYLQQRFGTFCCYESTQLQEYNQGSPP